MAEAWRWLAARGGAGPIDGLGRHLSLSSRQLRSLFVAELGVSPKRLAALMRFDRARQQLASATDTGIPLWLTDVALECGYYVHAHLDAEFRRFVGLSPSAWLQEERRNIQALGHVRAADSAA